VVGFGQHPQHLAGKHGVGQARGAVAGRAFGPAQDHGRQFLFLLNPLDLPGAGVLHEGGFWRRCVGRAGDDLGRVAAAREVRIDLGHGQRAAVAVENRGIGLGRIGK
jgi:hypothetical protein